MGTTESRANAKACTHCGAVLHESYFHDRKMRHSRMSWCKACQREEWRLTNQRKRGGLRGYCKVQRVAGEQAVSAILSMIQNMRPHSVGVNVARCATGEIAYWQGAMKPPKGSEVIGLFDFDAKPEWIAEELAT